MGQLEDISDDLLNWLRVSLIFPANILFTTLGLIANVLIMIIQSVKGVRNSMTVGIIALSFTDFLVTFLQLVMYIFYVLGKVYTDSPVDFTAIASFGIGWIRYVCFFISGWITTVISIEKCVCVIFPFHVKRVFTKGRSFTAVLVIYGVHAALVTPIYFVQTLGWTSLTQSNETTEIQVLTFIYSDLFVKVETVVNNIYALALAVISQVILIACTVTMVYGLKLSSRIRHKPHRLSIRTLTKIAPENNSSALSKRERKLVKVALDLGLVLTASNIPRYIVVSVYYGVPGMSQGAYKNLSDFLWDVTDFFSTINCSSNFMVYWLLNSYFRTTCLKMFTSCSKRAETIKQ